MSLILTFLGKGGSGRTTVAIATAKKLASAGKRILLAGQDPSPIYNLFLGVPIASSPTEVETNLKAVSLSATAALESSWEQVKDLEAKYLRSPILKNVYGQELGILPGMDSALVLNAIREYEKSGQYDVIVYDGAGALNTIRMMGIPDVTSWYIRRFRKVFNESDLGKTISPFIQPLTAAILNFSWSLDNFAQEPTNEATNLLDEGKAALADPKRITAYLVTTEDPTAIATAKYLWGSSQQAGLTVSGVLFNKASSTDALVSEFAPLCVSAIPNFSNGDWQTAIAALPDFSAVTQVPQPVSVDLAARQVKVFLPGLDKKQVKLTQYGPEITIEAADQRRNLDLPSQLRGQPIKGAKFQNGYLIISF
jgi:arsenite-transporting ATPase